MDNLAKIIKLVEESKNFPNCTIEYSFELPEHSGITKDSFFGVKAKYNKETKSANIIFNY